MADRADLLYRPDIKAPVREIVSTLEPYVESIKKEDIPDNIIVSFSKRISEIRNNARILSDTSRFLMDLIIEDIDGYVGSFPSVLLDYIKDLTGIDLAGIPDTDPAFTLDKETIKCIFRVANYYGDYDYDPELIKSIENWDSASFNRNVMKNVEKMGYLKSIQYGITLLIMVVKICYVILIHYTVGYQCALAKELNIKIKIPKPVKKSIKIPVGDKIAKFLKKIENSLLKIVGFRCNSTDKAPDCTKEKWDKIAFRKITCCTTSPFFFSQNSSGQPMFQLSMCFQQWIDSEINEGNPVRYICDYSNQADTSLVPTAEEIAKASAIAKHMMENPSITDAMSRSDLYTLKSAKSAADQGVMMTDNIDSVLSDMRTYSRKDESGPWYNCFGYAPTESGGADQKSNLYQRSSPGAVFIETGAYFQEYMKKIDDGLMDLLLYADKIITGTANLAKWSSSKQLCCYIYLLVTVSSLFHSLMTAGSICEGLDSENEDSFTNAIRNELRWARNLQENKNVDKFVALLTLIKTIIDIFISKMERGLFLQGIVLPFGEMFEMIKLTLINGISQFMDILFGPLDTILVNIKAVPEFRHMINNQCFGFDKLMDFLSCSLGSLKHGILLELDDIFNKFRLEDVTLINDIYISRTRLEFLKALSKLLKLMIGMIASLKDCYTPDSLINNIMDKQQEEMYNGMNNLNSLLGSPERARRLDAASNSLFGQDFLPDDETIMILERDPSRLSSAFGELGMIGDTIIQNDLFRNNGKSKFNIVDFLGSDGNLLPPAEFIKKAEEFSDIKLHDVRSDLVEIFDILRGR